MAADQLDRLRTALAGRYAIERELGRGGMATVYLAEDLKHERRVALKVLKPELAHTLGPERFLREIKITARLSHPHILPLLDSGDADGCLYYVMPYVEGESLKERLERRPPVTLPEALRVTREIAAALGYAHGRGVIHRDIKPENILLSGGTAVVADFGIATAVSEAGGSKLTQAGMAVGTPMYMSPEQCVGGEGVDGRSDLYSLACVLYEMLTGVPPFEGGSAQAVMARRFSDPQPGLARAGGTLPREISGALTRAFATEPVDRFATVSEFVEALEAGAAAAETHTPAPPGRVIAAYVVAGGLVLLAAVFLVLQLGLPMWVAHGALAVVVLGLPAVSAAATRNPTPARRLTVRRTVAGVGGALALWGAVAAGYMAMRLLGIGPVGTLVASGVLGQNERILLVEFANHTADSTLGTTITEALRVDLAESPVVSLAEGSRVAHVLARMERPPTVRLDLDLAREVAQRDGIGTLIAGEINPAGSKLVVSARLIGADSGIVLAAFRETAPDAPSVIEAVDRLSSKIRERIGESLRSIRRGPPLEDVTTSSLEALRRYTQAVRAIEAGDRLRGRTLLLEAIARDSTFAMAYRKLGVVALERAEQVRALTRAFEYSHRLPDRERYLALGTYYSSLTGENQKAIDAYRSLLDVHPNEVTAIFNLAGLLVNRRDHTRAESLYTRILEIDSLSGGAYTNLITVRVNLGRVAAAESTFRHMVERLPDFPPGLFFPAFFASAKGDYAAAAEAFARVEGDHRGNIAVALPAKNLRAVLALLQGRLTEAERLASEVIASAGELGISTSSLTGEISLAQLDAQYRGNTRRALRRVDAALERYPLDAIDPLNRPYVQLAQFYTYAEEPDRARSVLAAFEAAVDSAMRRPADASHRTIVGMIALAESRPDDAVTLFREADQGPCAICILPLLGIAYDRAGLTDSTLAVYERYVSTPFLTRMITDAYALPDILARLGEVYEERGDTSRALASYGRFLELWRDADSDLQPRVRAVRARVERITRER